MKRIIKKINRCDPFSFLVKNSFSENLTNFVVFTFFIMINPGLGGANEYSDILAKHDISKVAFEMGYDLPIADALADRLSPLYLKLSFNDVNDSNSVIKDLKRI